MASRLLKPQLLQHVFKTLTKPSAIRQQSTAAAAVVTPIEEIMAEGGIKMKGVNIAGRPLYLDMQATSPVDPRVLDAMLPYYMHRYGNPHSRTHLFGWESDQAVEKAREQVGCPESMEGGRASIHRFILEADRLPQSNLEEQKDCWPIPHHENGRLVIHDNRRLVSHSNFGSVLNKSSNADYPSYL